MHHIADRVLGRRLGKIVVATVLVFVAVTGVWLGLQLALGASPAAAFVATDHMNINSGGGWNPFARTLQVGDIVLIAEVKSAGVNANYPDSDIIVFHRPDDPNVLVASRVVAKQEIDGAWWFSVKGDGASPIKWPDPVTVENYEEWQIQNSSQPSNAVSQDLVVGKVILRVPLVGYGAVFVRSVFGVNDNFIAIIVPAVIVLVALVYAAENLRLRRGVATRSTAKT